MAPNRPTSSRRRAPLPSTTRVAIALGLLCAAAAATALPCAAGLAGCSGSDLQLCGQIPQYGCPIGRGGTCDDVACHGLYDCVEGLWQLSQSCPSVDGGGGSSAAGGSAGMAGAAGVGAGAGAGGCAGTLLDHTGEAQGCTPDLQLPDCPSEVAESCQPCLTGCADFYMCFEVGWQSVAYCTEDGELVVQP